MAQDEPTAPPLPQQTVLTYRTPLDDVPEGAQATPGKVSMSIAGLVLYLVLFLLFLLPTLRLIRMGIRDVRPIACAIIPTILLGLRLAFIVKEMVSFRFGMKKPDVNPPDDQSA